jgi:D-glycero-D-manno-heptose 1,7-bisphosphate phosphatase
MAANLKRALFLDRDGVINKDHGYVHQQDQFEFVPGIFEVVKTATEQNFLVIIVTNQSGIGRGYYTETTFHQLMEWVKDQFKQRGGNIDHVYFCPFHPEQGIGEYKQDSFDRKPNPGMFLKAQRDYQLDLSLSFFIGDQPSDLQAAIRAKIGHFLWLNPTDDVIKQVQIAESGLTNVTYLSNLLDVNHLLRN